MKTKKLLTSILMMLVLFVGLTLASCSLTDTKGSSGESNSSNTSSGGSSDGTDTYDEGYAINFVLDNNVTVMVYPTQELSNGYVANSTVSRDGTTGEILGDGNGQVNFLLIFTDGYELEAMTITGTYKNLKGSSDTGVENLYRITKIESDLTITITSKAEDAEEDFTGQFLATFVYDDFVTVEVFKTQDYTDGEETNTAYARNATTGTLTNDGNGQINFVLDFVIGYTLDSIVITGTYKNLKYPADTGVTNGYRITKIESDLTITITSKEKTAESSYSFSSSYDGTTYELLVETISGEIFAEVDNDGILQISTRVASEVSLSGGFAGGIQVNASGVDFVIDLEGVLLIADGTVPAIYVEDAENVDISVKKGSTNFIYDYRDASDDLKSAVYVVCDLKLKGSGSLEVYSLNNNGIHTKDDLTLQKLNLKVNSCDNALKGNDSITITSGTYTLIARQGDALKTSNSDISSKGIQRGTITISGGTLDIYAACDGIDAAYNVEITNEDAIPVINIYTDKYSSYSEEVTAVSNELYIRSTSTIFKYSVMFYNSEDDYVWKNSTSYETVSMGRNGTYYYYPIDVPSGYSKIYVFVYNSTQTQGQSEEYYTKSSLLTINTSYDTIAYSGSRFSWTNYSTSTQSGGQWGPGGMNDGNSDKGDYSTKGIKADNEILISAGVITIQSYDDALHANNDNELENGASPLGNITISGGTLTLASNDDGIHADNALTISNATIEITKSYEGLEGQTITINSGNITITASDDGINATSTSGKGITFNGGYTYLVSGGDGLDSNSKTSYAGIVFNGGQVIVISTSSNNSCIDTEAGYTYNGGTVIGICPTGMQNESVNCKNFSTVGKSTTLSLTQNKYLVVNGIATIKLPVTISRGFVVALTGSSSVSITQDNTTSYSLDANGVYFN